MYINRATLFFATGCAVIMPCLSLPLNGLAAIVEPRATYAVVPINGGSGQGGAGSGTGGPGGSGAGSGSGSGNGSSGSSGPGKQSPSPVAPVTVTVVQTPPARTSFHTVFMTPSKATDRVTDTIVITKTIEIVNIKPDTTITTSASGTISIAPNETTPRPSAISLSPKPSALTSTTSTISITLGFSTTATPASATSDTSTTVPAAVQTEFIGSSTTYDNGQWHTSYPAWNGTNLRRRLRLQPVAGLQ